MSSSLLLAIGVLSMDFVCILSSAVPKCISDTNRGTIQWNEQSMRGDIDTQQQTDWRSITATQLHAPTAVLLAQRCLPANLYIPFDLLQIVRDYANYNEIAILFQILPNAEDRMGVFGFQSYHQFHQHFRSRMSKVWYLKTLGRQRHIFMEGAESAETVSFCCHLHPTIVFDQSDSFIEQINLEEFLEAHITEQGSARTLANVSKDAKRINWNSVSRMKHLRDLKVNGRHISISMEDIQQCPDSLERLDISETMWKGEGLDLSRLPLGIKDFTANVQGLKGIINLAAPESRLERLELSYLPNSAIVVKDVRTQDLPPQLMEVVVEELFSQIPDRVLEYLGDKVHPLYS